MRYWRLSFSLSGSSSQLIGVGGENKKTLQICERYFVVRNKWSELPSLCSPRRYPGTVLLPSNKALCFCGENQSYLNSVETLQDENSEWKSLALDTRIAKTFHLAAVSFNNWILLFGGRNYASRHTHIMSEEGKLEKDLSQDALIPEGMCFATFTIQRGTIYALDEV